MNLRLLPAPPACRALPTNRIEALYVVACALSRTGYTDGECAEIMRQIDHGHPAVEALQQIGAKS